MKYTDKLKDPRWQRRRLEVFNRDNFTCLCCGAMDKTLCVHHLFYCGNPWDAPIEHLETLCEPCHDARSQRNKEMMGLSTRQALAISLKAKEDGWQGSFEPFDGMFSRAALLCPYCNFDYMHQGTVMIFNRLEDADDGKRVIVPIHPQNEVIISTSLAGNPSPRRQGLSINFSCENCDKNLWLNIFQHKGQTFFNWEIIDGGAFLPSYVG
jgi:hypothetical protein